MSEEISADRLVARVQELQEALGQAADPRGRELAEELVAAVVELYGEGLRRIVGMVEEAGDGAARVRDRMTGDGVVASLLLIHDLYPVPLEDRVKEALDSVRPYLESHGGNMELLGIEDGVARLRLQGSCKTCPASSATLELAVKQALDEAAPDLEGLVVEGIERAPAAPAAGTELPVVQVAPQTAGATPSWHDVGGTAGIEEGRIRREEVEGIPLLVARVDGVLLAFRDACAACGATLSGGTLLGGRLGCPECGVQFDLPSAGRAVANGGAQLEPVPLLPGDDGARVALAV
jgi:Fe-S cluster biogenesis protein NfuA/nitrite reductase/ring-hydroxylating ferredoxin subunit